MGSITIPGKHRRRGMEHQDEDYERTVEKLIHQEFEDWPNEAGFDGLTEVQGPVDLRVKGSIPAWAAGSLYRTGPGQYNVEDTPRGTHRTTHWFDGFGHSHKFQIIPNEHDSEGPIRVEYTSRRQTQGLVEEIKRTGRRTNTTFGQRQDVCVGLFSKIMTVWQLQTPTVTSPDIENISVTVQGAIPGLSQTSKEAGGVCEDRNGTKTAWLGTDNGTLKEFDTCTMETKRCLLHKDLHPLLKGPLSCAHPQRDHETGDYFNYNLEFGRVSTYRIFRSNASTSTTDILATISDASVKPAYIHSFFLSQNYVILCVPSTHISSMGLSIPWKRNIVDALEPFNQSNLCKWFVVDRRDDRGVVAQFETPAGFHFHSVNAFDEVDEATGGVNIFCDLLAYPNTDVIRSYELDVLLGNDGMTKNFWGDESRTRNSLVRLTRYKFSIPKGYENGKTKSKISKGEKLLEIKAPHVGELPTINPAFSGRDYRFFYSLPNRGNSTLLDSISKTNLKTCETLYWDNPKGHTPGEAIFVPRPRTNEREELAEDDGVLLSVVLDGYGKTSYLVCIDAKTMKEVGRAECEWAVAFGFHGLHTPY